MMYPEVADVVIPPLLDERILDRERLFIERFNNKLERRTEL